MEFIALEILFASAHSPFKTYSCIVTLALGKMLPTPVIPPHAPAKPACTVTVSTPANTFRSLFSNVSVSMIETSIVYIFRAVTPGSTESFIRFSVEISW